MINDLFDLSGRSAIVTGASSGLGWRFAETLARAGANLIVGVRRLDRIRTFVQRLTGLGAELPLRDPRSSRKRK